MAKNSSSSRAPKTGAQLQTTRWSAKNDLKRPKNPLIAAITLHKAAQFALCVPVSVAQLGVLKRRDELNLRDLHCARDPTSLHDHRDVHNRKNCTCGTPEHLSFTTTGMSPPCPRTATVEHHSFLHIWTPALSARNGHEDSLVQELGDPRRRPAQQGHRPPRRRRTATRRPPRPAATAAATPPPPHHPTQ